MKEMFIPIIIGALGTVTKGLIQKLEELEITGRVETVQTTVLLRSTKILRKVQETCCHSNPSGKLSGNDDVKKKALQKKKNYSQSV